MLKAEEQMELVVMKKHGESIRSLSRSTGRSRNTVRRYLRGGEAAARRKLAPKRAEKLDPFKQYIVGRQMQADWATVKSGSAKLKVSIATLGWSRMAYIEFCDDEQVETLIACHERAFLAFGGVPLEVLYDNIKTVVLERNTYGRGAHRFHPGFLDYIKHAGTLPRLCQPYRAQTKGKVERFIGYMKRSFWVATQRQAGVAPDKHSANAAVTRWLREVANVRVHATREEIPAERLSIEQPKLQGLPPPYRGRSARSALAVRERKPLIGYQHPLSVYDELAFGPAASDLPEVVA